MIYILEAFVEDYLHVLANVKIINIFNKIYPKEPIVFTSPSNHNAHVKKYFDLNGQITFQSIENLDIPTTNILNRAFLIMSRIYRDFVMLSQVFRKCQKGDVVVVTHIYFPSLILMKLIKKFHPKTVTFSIIHGDVEYAFYPTTLEQRIVGWFHRVMFKLKAKNFYYIFLTPVSKQILVDSNHTTSINTFAIELPTFPKEDNYVQVGRINWDNIRVGHVGSAGIRKNVQLFYQLATALTDDIMSNKLQLSNVGVLETSIAPFMNPLILNYVNNQINKPLSRAEYDENIASLNYSIFFYGKNDFILRSSAAFFDAIYYEKPIIALRNTFFDDLFEREGQLGYLCDNLEDMAVLVHSLTEVGKHRLLYDALINNIRSYKNKLKLETIALNLDRELQILKVKD
jgi:hypothetical protein